MIPELTDEQQRLIAESPISPPRFIAPRTGVVYVAIPLAEYEHIREILEDERERRIISEIAMRNAAERMDAEP